MLPLLTAVTTHQIRRDLGKRFSLRNAIMTQPGSWDQEQHAVISVSLATFELKPAAVGTRLVMTEQGVFLDGYDDAGSREHGSNFLLDALGKSLADQ